MYFIKRLYPIIVCLLMICNALYGDVKDEYDLSNVFNSNQVLVQSDIDLEEVNYKKIITKQDIDNSKSLNLADLLSKYSNISILQSSPYATTSVKINGSTSSNILILIDGVKMNDPTNPQSFYDISNIPLVFIEEIEIIEGSSVVQYGSGASFGVINIKTKQNRNDNKTSLFFKEEIGSNFTNNTQFGLNINKNNLNIMFFGNMFYTNGYSISSNPNTNYNSYNQDLENDSSKAFDMTFKINYVFNNNDYIELFYKKNYINANYDGSYQLNNGVYQTKDDNYYSINNDDFVYIKGNIKIFDTISNEIYFSNLQNSKQFYDASKIQYEGKEENISYLASVDKYENFNLRAGFDLSNQKMIDNQNKYSNFYHIFDTASYLILNENISNNFYLEQGLRMNSRLLDNSSYTTKNYAYNIGLSYNISDYSTFIKLNYASGYRLPSLYEIYSLYGNSGLQSEITDNINLSIQINNFSTEIDNIIINVYHNKINDLITLQTSYVNDGNYINNGINIESTIKINNSIEIIPSYAFVESKNTQTNKPAPNLPKNKANIDFVYKKEQWQTILQVSYNSSTIDFSTGFEENISSYTLLNVIVNINFNKQLNGYFKIYNILNTDYEIYKSYNTQGRSLYLGLNYYLN